MAAFTHRTCTFVAMLFVLLTTCVLECSSQAQPQIGVNGLFIVGQEKSLACYMTTAETVSSFPLTWSRGGSNLAASEEKTVIVSGNVRNYNSFYKFTVQPGDNGGTFTCTANLPSGTTMASWVVNASKGPDDPVVTGPSTVVSGVPSTWTCVVDGASGEASNVYWQFGNGSRLDPGTFNNVNEVYRDTNNLEIHKSSSTLSLTVSTGASNFGLSCYAVHFDTSIQKVTSRYINVTYPPQFNSTTPPEVERAKGETVILFCQFNSRPPATSITWYKNGEQLTIAGRYSGGNLTSPDLTITGLTASDSGVYNCSVTNDVSTKNSSGTSLDVFYPPEMVPNTTAITSSESTSVFIPCAYDANPPPSQITWTKDGVAIDINSAAYTGGTHGTGGLTIVDVEPSDAGVYECIVVNEKGTNRSGDIDVAVTYKPKVDVRNSNFVNAMENTTVLLYCNYKAFPAVTSLNWLRNGIVIDTSNSDKYIGGILNSPTLVIGTVQTSDDGVYRCRATNSIGTGESDNVTLSVNYPPKIDTGTPSEISGNESSSITVPCSIDAVPPLTSIEWLHNGNILDVSNTAKYSGGTVLTPPLTINNLQSSDFGVYQCRATNGFGTSESENTTVNVRCPPQILASNDPADTVIPGDVTRHYNLSCYINVIHCTLTGPGNAQPQDCVSNKSQVSVTGTPHQLKLTLVIRDVREEDSGTWTLSVENGLTDEPSIPNVAAVNFTLDVKPLTTEPPPIIIVVVVPIGAIVIIIVFIAVYTKKKRQSRGAITRTRDADTQGAEPRERDSGSHFYNEIPEIPSPRQIHHPMQGQKPQPSGLPALPPTPDVDSSPDNYEHLVNSLPADYEHLVNSQPDDYVHPVDNPPDDYVHPVDNPPDDYEHPVDNPPDDYEHPVDNPPDDYVHPVDNPPNDYEHPVDNPPNDYVHPVDNPPDDYVHPVDNPPDDYEHPVDNPPDDYVHPVDNPPDDYVHPVANPPNDYVHPVDNPPDDYVHPVDNPPDDYVHPVDNPPDDYVHPVDNPPDDYVHPVDNPPDDYVHPVDNPPDDYVHPVDNPPDDYVHPVDNPPDDYVHPVDNPPDDYVHPVDNPPDDYVHRVDNPPDDYVHPVDNPPNDYEHPVDNPLDDSVHPVDNPPDDYVHPVDNPPDDYVHLVDNPPDDYVHPVDNPPDDYVHPVDNPPDDYVHLVDNPPDDYVHPVDNPPDDYEHHVDNPSDDYEHPVDNPPDDYVHPVDNPPDDYEHPVDSLPASSGPNQSAGTSAAPEGPYDSLEMSEVGLRPHYSQHGM